MSVWIEGEVMHGRQLGRELGFPTANMEVADADATGVVEVAETIAAVTGIITKRVADADIAIKKRQLYILYRKGET